MQRCIVILLLSNYSVIANSRTLQFTTAHTKFFPAFCVFTSRWLVTASTEDVPLTSCSRNISVPQLPAPNSNSSQRLNCSSLTNLLSHQPTLHFSALTLINCLVSNISAWTHRKHRSSDGVQLFMLGICCPGTGFVYRVIT
jgi:hypothetical protein